MGQEAGILTALQSVRSFQVAEDGRLSLMDAGGQGLMRLTRVSP